MTAEVLQRYPSAVAAQASNVRDVEVSVVVPVHNEAGNIASLIAEIDAAMRNLAPYEIVYVDDGSDDGTAQALAEARAGNTRLRVIRHRVKCGQSAAIWTGVKAARGDCIATIDGDGQNDPADIAKLLARLRAEDAPSGLAISAGSFGPSPTRSSTSTTAATTARRRHSPRRAPATHVCASSAIG